MSSELEVIVDNDESIATAGAGLQVELELEDAQVDERPADDGDMVDIWSFVRLH